MAQRNLLQTIVPGDWNPGGQGFNRTRYLQGIDDLVNRPLNNRMSATVGAGGVVTAMNGAVQSTGVGCGPLKPQVYGELTVKARVSFSIGGAGSAYVFVYRTTGAIPANGAAPNAGDIPVAGGAFAGPANVSGQSFSGSFSFLDTPLSQTQQYNYYLAVEGTNAVNVTIAQGSQLLVMERA